MWVIPKNMKRDHASNPLTLETAYPFFFVQSKQASVRVWRSCLKTKSFGELLNERTFEIPSATLRTQAWICEIEPLLAQTHNQVTDFLWKIPTHFKFSKFPFNWERWSQDVRTQLKLRIVRTKDLWKTPTTTDVGRENDLITKEGIPWEGVGRAYRKNGSLKQTTLNYQVDILWPTPTTQEVEHKDIVFTHTGRRAPKSPEKTCHSLNLYDTAKLCSLCDEGGLNPRWVETLMGLPIGWVAPQLKIVYFLHER